MQLECYLHRGKEKLHVFCLLSLTSKVMLSSASGAETFKPRADAEENKHKQGDGENYISDGRMEMCLSKMLKTHFSQSGS